MKFRNPEMQARLEQLNSEGLSLDSLVEGLNVAKVSLEVALADGPGNNPMEWAQNVVAMQAQLSRAGDQLLKTAKALKLVVTAERLESFKKEWVDSWRDAVIAETDQDTFNRIVDVWRAKAAEFVA